MAIARYPERYAFSLSKEMKDYIMDYEEPADFVRAAIEEKIERDRLLDTFPQRDAESMGPFQSSDGWPYE